MRTAMASLLLRLTPSRSRGPHVPPMLPESRPEAAHG